MGWLLSPYPAGSSTSTGVDASASYQLTCDDTLNEPISQAQDRHLERILQGGYSATATMSPYMRATAASMRSGRAHAKPSRGPRTLLESSTRRYNRDFPDALGFAESGQGWILHWPWGNVGGHRETAVWTGKQGAKRKTERCPRDAWGSMRVSCTNWRGWPPRRLGGAASRFQTRAGDGDASAPGDR